MSREGEEEKKHKKSWRKGRFWASLTHVLTPENPRKIEEEREWHDRKTLHRNLQAILCLFSLLSLRGLNLRFTILPKPNQFCNIANSYNFQKKEQHSFEPRLLSFCVPIPCISKKYPICSMHKSRLYGYTWLELKRLQTLVALLSIFDCISWYVIRKVFGYFSCKLSNYHTIWSGRVQLGKETSLLTAKTATQIFQNGSYSSKI